MCIVIGVCCTDSCHLCLTKQFSYISQYSAGSVTSPGESVRVPLNGAVTLMWSFTLHPSVTATPNILVNGIKHTLEELNLMSGLSVEESAGNTTVVLTEVGVERNESRWRWKLEEFGGALQSDETVLVVQGVLMWAVCAAKCNGRIIRVLVWNPDSLPTHGYYCVTIERIDAKDRVQL